MNNEIASLSQEEKRKIIMTYTDDDPKDNVNAYLGIIYSQLWSYMNHRDWWEEQPHD